jgi:hypothetical protein
MPAYSAADQIEDGKTLRITDTEMRLKALVKLNDERYILLNTKSILSRYKPILDKYRKRYKLTGRDEQYYEYRPTLLSYDVYGTIELAPLILEMNGMTSAIEFTGLRNGIWMYSQSVRDVLNEIILQEENDIERNTLELKEDLSKI